MIKGLLRLLALYAALVTAWAANDSLVAEKIQRVQGCLLPPSVIKDRPAPCMALLERMRFYKVPGVSIAVIHNYAIEWAKGYGVADTDTNQPVTTETLFQAGSISKPVAAVAAMHLVELGDLSLDQDVNEKLKSWKVPENEFTKDQKVTLRRIMSHSAGLTVHGFPGYSQGSTIPSLIDILEGRKPANTPAIFVDTVPGTRFRYSGGGYTIMQLLVTDVTGKPFPDFIEDTVLSKAGMNHSTYEQPLPKDYWRVAASGYNAKGDPVLGKWNTYPEMAAAGLWTTPSDLAKFATEIQLEHAGKSKRLLAQATVNEMLKRQKDDLGLSFFLESTGQSGRFGHNGADMGFQSFMLATMETGDGVVVMTNSDAGGRLAPELARAVGVVYNWPDYRPTEHAMARLSVKALEVLTGEYDLDSNLKFTVAVEQDHLLLSTKSEAFRFYPESSDTFFNIDPGLPNLIFVREGDDLSLTLGKNKPARRVRQKN